MKSLHGGLGFYFPPAKVFELGLRQSSSAVDVLRGEILRRSDRKGVVEVSLAI